MFLATAIFCWRLSTIYDFPPKVLTTRPSVGGSWQGFLGSRSSYSVNPCASKKSGPSLLSLDAQTHNPTLPAVVFAVARARLPPPSGRLARVHTGQRGSFVYFSGDMLDIERTCPTMHAYIHLDTRRDPLLVVSSFRSASKGLLAIRNRRAETRLRHPATKQSKSISSLPSHAMSHVSSHVLLPFQSIPA